MVTNGRIEYRCIHKESDLYRQIVDTICEECPFNRPIKIISKWDNRCGLCASRKLIDNKKALCKLYGKEATQQECENCRTKVKEYQETKLDKKDYPSIVTQANNYRLAVTRWIKAGRPIRSGDEIKIIYKKFCLPCDWYDKKSSRCKGCGCRVVPKGLAIFNKLKMATEHCPKSLF